MRVASVRAMSHLVLLEGLRRVDPATPLLRADDLGVLRGESVFETLRISGGRPAFLAAHLARLAVSADRLDLTLPHGWEDLALTACDGVDEGVLRLVCAKGPPPLGFALVTDIPADAVRGRTFGVPAVTLTLGVTAAQRAEAPYLLGGVKSTSYAINMATLRHARALGAEEAIWVSSDGELLEAPTATVALIVNGVLVTPPTSVGILAGTTLGAVLALDQVPSDVRRVTVEELHAADEVMLLSSVRGVAPVVSLDGRELGVGPVTVDLRDAFEASLLR